MPAPAPDRPEAIPEGRVLACPGVRYGLIAFGWLNVTLGVVGLFLPLVPTTVFLLLGLWAFSRSSTRFHRWLYGHPRLGRSLRAWHEHRMIPLPAKLLSVAMMGASLLFVTLYLADDWPLPAALAVVLGAVSAYILSRPHRLAA